jgi:hypothetical protein
VSCLPTEPTVRHFVPSGVTPIPIHAGSPNTPFQMSAVQPSPTAANTFAVKWNSFSTSSVNINSSDGELGHISHHSSSWKPRARHSLLKELNLAMLPELTLRKRKLYEHTQNKESALCKPREKYKGMNSNSVLWTVIYWCRVFQCRGCQIFCSNF